MPKIVSDLKVRLEDEMGSGYHVTWNTKKKNKEKKLSPLNACFLLYESRRRNFINRTFARILQSCNHPWRTSILLEVRIKKTEQLVTFFFFIIVLSFFYYCFVFFKDAFAIERQIYIKLDLQDLLILSAIKKYSISYQHLRFQTKVSAIWRLYCDVSNSYLFVVRAVRALVKKPAAKGKFLCYWFRFHCHTKER